MPKPIILTLTSIPPRFQYLPRFFADLEWQTEKPDRVELTLARSYARFPGAVPSLPPLPDWVDVHWVDEDLGPATKVLPACARHRGQPVELLMCDDDRRHGPNWIKGFRDERARRPDVLLAGWGASVSQRLGLPVANTLPEPHGICARLTPMGALRAFWPNVWSWAVHNRRTEWVQTSFPGYVDFFYGFRGVLLSPDTFRPEAWNIPDDIKPVDDVWLSGQAAVAGARIWLMDAPINRVYMLKSERTAPLFAHVHKGMDRVALNANAIRYFQQNHGIWT